MNGLSRAGLAGVALLLSSCTVGGGEEACVRERVLARPSSGGSCAVYASTCDVPEGFVECCGGFEGGCVGGVSGTTCADDPTDTCDPSSGGRDCPGICQ